MRVIYSPSRRELASAVVAEISRHHRERPFARGFLLVPEQQKASMERLYFAANPEQTLMLEEVLSFRRFALRLAELGGGQGRSVMSPGLQTYYLGQMLNDLKPELTEFTEAMFRPSFLSRISEAIGDFLRYNVKPAMLLEAASAAEQEGERRFAARMRDYALLLETYQVRASEGNLLPGDLVLDDLASRLETLQAELELVGGDWASLRFPWHQYEFLRTSTIWIHGFGTSRSLTPQESRIVTSLNALCHEVLITAESDRLPSPDYSDVARGPASFRSGRHLLQSLQHDYTVMADFLPLPAKRPRYEFHRFERQIDEVRRTAGEIRRLLAEENLVPSSIGIALADAGAAPEMQQALKELAIPFYTSDTLRTAQGAFRNFLRALSDFLNRGWDQEFLMPLLRNHYMGIPAEKLDELENFWLARGIKGNLIWDEDRYAETWQPQAAAPQESEEDEESESIEEEAEELTFYDRAALLGMRELRDLTLGGLQKLFAKTRGQKSVSDFSKILLTYFAEEGIEERVKERSHALLQDDRDEAEFEIKAWNEALSLLADFSVLEEESLLPLSDYLYYLGEALEQSGGRRIPATGNQVVLGSLQVLAQEHTDYLFVLGATETNLPGKGFQTSLLTQTDRLTFNRYFSDEILPESEEQHIYANESHLHGVLNLPSGLVSLSFTGAAERGAQIVSDLLQQTQGELHYHATPYSLRDPLLALPERAFAYSKSQAASGEHPQPEDLTDLADLEAWLGENRQSLLKAWGEPAGRKLLPNGQLHLDPALIRDSDGEAKVWSISQLERYSACPFSYYANNLLRLEERAEWTPDAASYGTLIHKVMEEQQRDWQDALAQEGYENAGQYWQAYLSTLNEEQILDYFTKAREEDPSLGLFWEKGTAYATRHKAARAALAGSMASVLEYAGSEGMWFPQYEEWAFGPETSNPFTVTQAGRTLTFRGCIDRVDLAKAAEGNSYVRLIDYKSGLKRVSYEDLYSGLDLQLPIYLQAFESLSEGESLAVDAAYAPVSPTVPLSEAKPLATETANEKIIKGLKFSNLGLEVDALHKLMDKSLSRADELVTQMNQGDFSAQPRSSKPDKAPCRFCNFRMLCGIDRGRIRLRQTPRLDDLAASYTEDGLPPSVPSKMNAQQFYLEFILNHEDEANGQDH